MSHPWMPFYVGDYLSKTQRLTAAEHGAYLLLIMEYWQSGSPPPDDDAILARICRMSAKEWRKVRAAIASFFYDGWHHHRIEEELAKADGKHQRRVEAGSRGGKAAAKGKQTDSNAGSNATTFAQASSSQPQSEEIPSESQNAREIENDFTRFWSIYPHRVGKPAARRAFTKARKSFGFAQIVVGLERYMAQKPGDHHWLNPATFLNQERFNDEPASTTPAIGRDGKPSAHDALLRAVAEQFAEGEGPGRNDAGADGGLFDQPAGPRSDHGTTLDLGPADYRRTG